jgi:hypothetical protein
MSPPVFSCKYYFDTDTFIEIVLELELYPERAIPPRADFSRRQHNRRRYRALAEVIWPDR